MHSLSLSLSHTHTQVPGGLDARIYIYIYTYISMPGHTIYICIHIYTYIQVTGGLDARSYLQSLQECDPIQTVPDDFVLAARVAALLRGLGSLLGLRVCVARHWRPVATRALRQARFA